MTGDAQERIRTVARTFDLVAGTYDQVDVPWFTPIAARLVAELAPAPGERALDVGCGRGAVLFALADAVGRSGHVTAFDAAPAMVAAVAADVAERGVTQVEVSVMDASAPALAPASYDLVAASLVLFFLPDPGAALAGWAELLVPGGRIGISTFGPRDPGWEHVDQVFLPHLPARMLDARTSGTTGPFGSDAGVEALFTAAGLEDVRTVVVRMPVTFRDAAQWEEWSWSHGQRRMWEQVPEAGRPEVLAEATRRLAALRDDSGSLTTWQDVRYTLGRRP